MPLSTGGVWGTHPPQHCKRIATRNWIQSARIRRLNPLKILQKSMRKYFPNPNPEAPKSRSGGFWAALGCFLVTIDLPDASGTPSRRLWGGSWGRFRLILPHLGGVLGAQDGPMILPRRPKMLLRCLQDTPRSDFQQKKYGKMSPSSSDGIFYSILVRFYFKNTSPNFEKYEKYMGKIGIFSFQAV